MRLEMKAILAALALAIACVIFVLIVAAAMAADFDVSMRRTDWHVRGRHSCGYEKVAPLGEVAFLEGKVCPKCGDYIKSAGWGGIGGGIDRVVARWQKTPKGWRLQYKGGK